MTKNIFFNCQNLESISLKICFELDQKDYQDPDYFLWAIDCIIDDLALNLDDWDKQEGVNFFKGAEWVPNVKILYPLLKKYKKFRTIKNNYNELFFPVNDLISDRLGFLRSFNTLYGIDPIARVPKYNLNKLHFYSFYQNLSQAEECLINLYFKRFLDDIAIPQSLRNVLYQNPKPILNELGIRLQSIYIGNGQYLYIIPSDPYFSH